MMPPTPLRSDPLMKLIERVCVLTACQGRTQAQAAALLGVSLRKVFDVRRRAGIGLHQRRVEVDPLDRRKVLQFLGADPDAVSKERHWRELDECRRRCDEQAAAHALEQEQLTLLLEHERREHALCREQLERLDQRLQELREAVREIDELRQQAGRPRTQLDARAWQNLTPQERLLRLHGEAG